MHIAAMANVYVVRADEKLTGFCGLESAILPSTEAPITFALAFQLLADLGVSQTEASELINNVLFTPAGVEVQSCR